MYQRSSNSRRTLKRRFRKLQEAFARVFAALSFSIRSPLRAFSQAIRFIGHGFGQLSHSANFRHLLAGLPALLTLILSLTFFSYQYFRSADIRNRLSGRYATAAMTALQKDERTTAVAYFDRLISLRGEDNEALFGLARALDPVQDSMRLATVQEKIAPLDRAVYAPAHIWMARRYLGSKLTKETTRAAEIHLVHAYDLDNNAPEANVLLGRLYFLGQRYQSAVFHLEKAIDQFPSELLELAKCYAALNRTVEAEQYGLAAIEHFQQALAKDMLNVKIRLKLAESLMFFDKFELSLDVLQQGLVMQDSPELKNAVARVHLMWSERLKQQQQHGERLVHIQAAMAADPSEVLAFRHVMEVLNQGDTDSQTLREYLTSILAEGKATALVHLLLGTDAGERGDSKAAARHLDLAVREDPQMTFAANNLAWVLAHENPPDYQRALALIEAALVHNSQSDAFHHTRGIILVGLERWQEAVVELERSLPTKGDKETRLALAKAYENLGLPDLAAEQRKLAAQIPDDPNGPNENH